MDVCIQRLTLFLNHNTSIGFVQINGVITNNKLKITF